MTALKQRMAYDTYDEAITEAEARNSRRRTKQNVVVFLVHNIPTPQFMVCDCGADYRPEPPRIHNPAAEVARVALIDRNRLMMEHFSYA